MKFAHFFIDRPVFAIVISIAIVIAGTLSIFNLPIAQYPQIAPPTVTVTASYPGASAEVVAKTVATPMEEQINGVENMLYMSSQATNDGNLKITVTFALGTNLDIAQVQVQNRVAIAQPQLPQEVRNLGVVIKKASPDITLVVEIYSPDDTFDRLFISNFTSLQIRDELARLPGVGDLNVFGVRDYSMRLWLDPDRLAALNLTTTDFVTAIQEQNVQVAAGTIGGAPQPAGKVPFQYTVQAVGRLTDPQEFANIVIKTGDKGQVARVKDVARVELGAADYSTENFFDTKPAVGIAIFQLPGSNAIDTADAIYKKMKELKATFPKGLDYAIPYDTTLYVRASIKDVVITLFEAIGLVVIVVLVFLQSWRASLVPLLAIPVSLVGTFGVMYLFGFSLNNLSLFGMVLAIGIVVDDAIVVVENVQRWLDEGLQPREATYKAMDEVTGAVIAIALGLSAVFVPVAFVSGITGQFYRQFALTIAFSTLLSAFNSLTLSPALAALLLTPKGAKKDILTRIVDFTLGWFFRLFNRILHAATGLYASGLTRVVRLSVIALLVYAGLLFLTYLGFKTVPTGFIPSQDQGYVIAVVSLPDAASIDRTERTVLHMIDIAKNTPGVEHVVALPGFSVLAGVNQPNAGTMFIALNPFEERAHDPSRSGNAIIGKLAAQFSKVEEGVALVFPPPPVRGIGTAGGFRMQIEDRSGLATPQELAAVTGQMISDAQADGRLTSLVSTFHASVPQLFADIDRVRAKQQNVVLSNVFQTLQVYLGSLYVNDFNYLGRTFRVVAQADAPFRADATKTPQFKTRNGAGNMVPLGAVMTLKDIAGPDRINRYNLYQSAEINGSGKVGVSSGQALDIMQEIAKKDLPQGYTFEWTELAFQETTAGNTALLIFPLCILLVWLTHSAEYESFALSTAIILIVPMCLLCGIAGVWLRGMDNNIFTQIGFVVLAGLSAKNAVLIVEFAVQQQEKGMNAFEAAIEAARLRLRPILMTSFAFILGVVPLITASGAGSEMRQALGTAVFYGMIGVTVFGLILTPVFYVTIRRLTGRYGPTHPAHETPATA